MFAIAGTASFLVSGIYAVRPILASGPSSNRVLNYQIRLTDASGIPTADGTKNIKLSFYDAASGGTRLATDCGTTVTPVARKAVFTNGTASVLLGDTAADGTHNCADGSAPNALPSSLFSNPVLYLGITVGSDAEMTPRKRIVAQGYALNADLLDDLDTSNSGGTVAFIPATDGSGNLTLTKNLNVDSPTFVVDSANDRVGMGTATPASRLQVTGITAVTGDYFVDSDGSAFNDNGYFPAVIPEGSPLVSAAAAGLCTDSLTAPTKVYKDGNGDCTPGNGGTDAVLVNDSAGATVPVTSAWSFNDADTDCNGDGVSGDVGCTASDGIYQDGQDLYIDNAPSLTFNSANLAVGTAAPQANLHVVGTGVGYDFAGYPAVAVIEAQSSTDWSLVFQSRAAGLDKLMGFYQDAYYPAPSFVDSNAGALFLASANVIDSIQAWSQMDRRTAVGLFDTWSTLAVRSDPDKAGLAGTTTANASTTITGVGTMFYRDLGVGDRISLSSAPTAYATVTAIASDTSLTVDVPLGDGTSQTINRKSGIARFENSAGGTVLSLNDEGRMGVGTLLPDSQLTVGQPAIPIGSIFGGSDGIGVSKTLTAYGTAGQFQAVWDFPSAGFGITGTVSVAQTRDTNANNMTGVMTGMQGIAEHLGSGTATEIVGAQGSAYDRVGGVTTDAIGLWGNTVAQTATITNAVGIQGENGIFSSGTITNAYAVAARQSTLASGTVTGNVGLQVDDFTVGTNKTDVLIGTRTIPAGNYSLYSASSYDSAFAGKLGIGDSSPASLLTVGNGDRFNVNGSGDVTSTFTALDGSSTTNGAGANSTSMTLNSVANFDIGNYVQLASAACIANPCFAKITNIVGFVLTISPALSWNNADAVTEVHVPEVGGVDLTQALANRYGRGYFIDGIVTGNGSTSFTDGKIESAGTLRINASSNQPVTFGTGTVTLNGQLTTAAGTNSNFDSNTLFVDATNHRVGVGTASPTNPLTVALDGTAAAPSLSFGTAADGNTGIFHPASGTIAVTTGGAERFRVDASGDVGIGTASPTTALDVVKSDNAPGGGLALVSMANTSTSGGSVAGFAAKGNNGSAIGGFGVDGLGTALGTAGTFVGSLTADPLMLITGDSEKVRITSSGNVGIGDTSPAALFTVGNGDKFQIDASGNLTTPSSVAWTLNNAVNALNIDANTFSVDALNNRVGIGTSAPTFSLDVSGATGIRATGPSITGLTLKSTDVTSDFMGIRWRDNADAVLWSMGNDFNGNGNQDFWLYDNVNFRTVLIADQAATSFLSFGTTNGGLEYDNVTQQLRVFTNGTNKLYVNGTGEVGIGTASPVARFDVSGNARFTGRATAVLTGSIDPIASTAVTGVGTAFTRQLVIGDRITVSGETRTVTAIASDTSLTVDTPFSDNANDTSPDVLYALATVNDPTAASKFVISDVGDVGIGTAAPTSALDIVKSDNAPGGGLALVNVANTSTSGGSVAGYMAKGNDGAVVGGFGVDGLGTAFGTASTIVGSLTADPLIVFTGNAEKMRITASGDVGIGTASPISQLHVPGRAAVSVGTVSTGSAAYTVFVKGKYAYVTNFNGNSLQVIDVSVPASPVVVSTTATGSGPNSVTVQGRYAYLVNSSSGTLQVFDVADPAAPSLLSTTSVGSNPLNLAVQGRYAYVANFGGSTLQIFDVADPAAPKSVSTTATAAGPIFVRVQGNYAYVAAYNGGSVQVIDVTDPAAPSVSGAVATGSTPRSLYVQGRYVYATNETAGNMKIIDVSNPASPAVVGTATTGNGPRAVFVQDRYAYVFNHDDATLQTFDVSNPASPTSVGTGSALSNSLSIFVQGRYAYAALINTSQLQVFDVGGAYLQQLEAGGIDAATLNLQGALQGFGAEFAGSLTVGKDLQVTGDAGFSRNAAFTSAGGTIDFASGTAGNDFSWQIPTRASGTCSSGTKEGVVIRDNGGTQRGHICIDAGTPLLKFYANQFNTTSTDIAETYSARPDEGIEAGDVVELDPAGDLMVRKTTAKSAAGTFGVVSTAPGVVLSGIDEATGKSDTTHGVNVALKGRVPVKVNMENGPIAVGDELASSSTPGVAMKAAGNGMVIGRALDAASEDGTVRVFVEVGWWNGGDVLGATSTSGAGDLGPLTAGVTDFDGHDLLNARSVHGIGDVWSISEDGTVAAKDVVTDAVSVRQTDAKTTLDRATVPSGKDFVQVHNPAITPDSKVFVTMKKNPGSQWWVDEVGDGFLVVKTAQPVVEDIPFDYWVVGTVDERTPAAPAPAASSPDATASAPSSDVAAPSPDAAPQPPTDPAPASGPATDATAAADPATAPAASSPDATATQADPSATQ